MMELFATAGVNGKDSVDTTLFSFCVSLSIPSAAHPHHCLQLLSSHPSGLVASRSLESITNLHNFHSMGQEFCFDVALAKIRR